MLFYSINRATPQYSNVKPKTVEAVPKPCYGTFHLRICVWVKQMVAEHQRRLESISAMTRVAIVSSPERNTASSLNVKWTFEVSD